MGMTRMPLRASLPTIVPLALVLAACHQSTGPSSLAGATSRAKALWSAAGIHSYSFTASRSCECVPESSGPVRITVVNDQMTSVVMASGGQSVSPTPWFDIYGLFSLIDRELTNRPAQLEASFDAATGYPTHVRYGDLAVDAGADIVVTNFTATP